MTEKLNDFKVTVPPGAARVILKGYEDLKATLDADLNESNRTVDRLIKVSELRNAFYEKIILLAGGSFALSLTFLTGLQRSMGHDSHVSARWCLELSWAFLLLCIFLSWLHNRHRIAVVESTTAALAGRARSHYNRQHGRLFSLMGGIFEATASTEPNIRDIFEAASKGLEDSAAEADQLAQGLKASLADNWAIAQKLGHFAFLSISFAFLLMLVFALKNASLLF